MSGDYSVSVGVSRTQADKKTNLRRSHLEVKMDILTAVSQGVDKPTQIMYKANLSWNALQDHFRALLEGGLMREVEYGTRRKFELTEKAFELLSAYRKIVEDLLGRVTPSNRAF